MKDNNFGDLFDELLEVFLQGRESVPVSEFIHFIEAVQDSVKRRVEDKEQRKKIINDLILLEKSITAVPGEMFSTEIFNSN